MNTLSKELESVIGSQATKIVTVDELASILKNTTFVKGMSAFAKVVQLTEPKCTVKDRKTKVAFNDKIQKLSVVSIILNAEYEKQVTNQLEREDKNKSDYKKGKNTMPLVKGENNNFFGTFYGMPVLEYRPNDNVEPTVKYFLNEVETDKGDLPDVLPAKSKATNQGTDREIFWRKLYLRNVILLAFNGTVYQVV